MIFINGKDTVSYNRSSIDSMNLKADKSFINDKIWLLVPFQLIWDEYIAISEPIKVVSPISREKINVISIKYPNEGGYTPGDTYDIFFDSDYIIQEWTYQSVDSLNPAKSYTFQNYKDLGSLKIATEHKKFENELSINFSNIKVNLEE